MSAVVSKFNAIKNATVAKVAENPKVAAGILVGTVVVVAVVAVKAKMGSDIVAVIEEV